VKNILKFLLAAFLLAAVFTTAAYAAEGNVIALMYHDLTESAEDAEANSSWTTTPEKFRADVQTLLDAGYVSISCEMYKNGDYDLDQNYFIITFDDGYLSNYTLAYPIIKEMNIYADIFMTTALTMRANHFKYYQANLMEKSGLVKVYSHMPSHETALDYSIEKCTALVNRSFTQLKLSLKQERSKIFAYPGGSYNEDTYNALIENGIELQVVQDYPYWAEDHSTEKMQKMGILIRRNVSYDADMKKIIEEW